MPHLNLLREAARRGIDGLREATLHAPRAHRNLMLGLWAGKRLGHDGPALVQYVLEVMEADHEAAGDADVVRKLMRDFAGSGTAMTEADVQAQLMNYKRHAFAEMSQTD